MSTSPLVRNILKTVIDALEEQNLIERTPGSTAQQLLEDVTTRLKDQRAFAQFSGWLSKALLDSPHVEELYASDEDLLAILREVSP